MITPKNKCLFVKVIQEEDAIVRSQEAMKRAEVVAVASDVVDVKVGDVVIYRDYNHPSCRIDSQRLTVVPYDSVVAVA